jgi:predicted DNA-binding transcriptional regulator AlpA
MVRIDRFDRFVKHEFFAKQNSTPSSMMRLVNLRQLQQRFKVSRVTVWRWTRDGDLPNPVIKQGSPWWDLNKIESERSRLLNATQVQRCLHFSSSTLFRASKEGSFPEPQKRFGSRTWTEEQIEDYWRKNGVYWRKIHKHRARVFAPFDHVRLCHREQIIRLADKKDWRKWAARCESKKLTVKDLRQELLCAKTEPKVIKSIPASRSAGKIKVERINGRRAASG